MRFQPTLQELVHQEIGERPAAANGKRVTHPTRDIFGMALSGGGIRSATFNLGLLQGLNHFGLLRTLDYLSTVSGGGYVASFWMAWRQRRGSLDGDVFPQGSGSDSRPEPDEIRHLREFGNFLSPHLGILSWDTGRMLVTLVSSVIPSLLISFSVIGLAILLWCLLAYGLFALEPVRSVIVYLSLTTLMLAVTEAVWHRRQEERNWPAYVEALLWSLLAVGAVWWGLQSVLWPTGWYGIGQRLPVSDAGRDSIEWLYLFAPVLPWAAASFVLSVRRWLGSRWVRGHVDRVRRNSFDRVHGRFILASAVWTVLSVLWILGVLFWKTAERGSAAGLTGGLTGTTVLVVWWFARMQKGLSTAMKVSLAAGPVVRLKSMLPRLLAYVAVTLMVVATVAAIVAFDQSDFSYNPPLTLALAAAFLVVLATLTFNPNEVGLHTFYRARLARAYLGASNPDPQAWRKTEERSDDDVHLNQMKGSPCHLICCAANDLAASEMGTLNRGAESAVISPIGFTVAEERYLWADGGIPAPTLSAAMTASAAAFNPLMGGLSRKLGPCVTFLMAALNLRLGLWLPRESGNGLAGWIERRLVGLPFFKEMLSLARARGRHVHLSDGGHFENMAVYELIRRHCRFVVASDCGMDSMVNFDDFGNLVRRVRADFGVDIQIDLSPLRPDVDGISRQPMVAGDIHYPEGDTGILLLIKPSINGSEPADVAQYHTRNPGFPHESTADQFYDEAQWEAYRRLGEFVAESAFRPVTTDLDTRARNYLRHVFLRARREWQAIPEGFGDRMPHFSQRIAELERMLVQPEYATLLRQVYREIDDLASDSTTSPTPVPGEATVVHSAMDESLSGEFLPDPADLGPSLHLIREALLLMHESYIREDLDRNHRHPLYLGLMNYFGRWSSASLFRMWWPLLKAMYPQPFTRFVEGQFGVRGGRNEDGRVEGEVGSISGAVDGFAMSCWKQQRPDPLNENLHVVPYLLKLHYQKHEHEIQAAQVVVAQVGSNLAWDTEDFFVPPGLWGIGIGENFLRGLRTEIGSPRRPPPHADYFDNLFVRIRPAAGAGAKKQAVNEIQLYQSAGFQEISEDDVPEEVKVALLPDRPDLKGRHEVHREKVRWMHA